MSANLESFADYVRADLMRNEFWIGRLDIGDNISDGDNTADGYNRGNTVSINTECERGDVLWVRAYNAGTILADSRNRFTGRMLRRF